MGSDVQTLLRIEPGDGTAAGAHFDDVDDRRFNWKAFDIAAGVVEGIHRKAAVLDQRAFRRSAAHVEGDDVFKAELVRVGAGADAAADGAGFH